MLQLWSIGKQIVTTLSIDLRMQISTIRLHTISLQVNTMTRRYFANYMKCAQGQSLTEENTVTQSESTFL